MEKLYRYAKDELYVTLKTGEVIHCYNADYLEGEDDPDQNEDSLTVSLGDGKGTIFYESDIADIEIIR